MAIKHLNMSFNYKFKYLVIFLGILSFKIQTNAENQMCGRIAAGRGNIVGGNYAERGKFPWAAVLTNNQGKIFCGGTLLRDNKVITAAHCIKGKDNAYNFTPESIKVILGAHNISISNEGGRIVTGVKKIQIHRDWNITAESFDADIAILTLNQPVAFTKYIQPICLIEPNSRAALVTSGYSIGYGKSEDESKDTEDVLKYIKTPIHSSNEECFYSNEFLYKLSSLRTFCGGSRGNVGVCMGDSGNGLFVELNGVHYIRGIVSASLLSHGNCDVNNYAIFTNMLKFFDWIVEKVEADRIGNNISPRISLIGSHFLPINSNYKAFLFHNQIEQDLNLNITLLSKGFAKSLSFDSIGTVEQEVELELPSQKSRDYTLKITANTQNQCMTQAVKILNLQEYPLIFIHIDKPVYRPGDELKIQIFIMNQKLLPFTNQTSINVKIYDPIGNIQQSLADLEVSKFGHFEKSITILINETIGKWKVEVQANNRKKFKEFQVQSHDEDFEVMLDIPEVLPYKYNNFTMKIYVKDDKERFFDGTAKISVGKTFKNSKIVDLKLFGIKTEVNLNFVKDLGISSLTGDMKLIFDVEVSDLLKQKTASVQKTVDLKYNTKYNITIVRKSFFKPSFDFPIKIRVKNLNEVPDTFQSNLYMSVEYKNKDGITQGKQKTSLKLTNGVATDILQPSVTTDKIIIQIKVSGTFHEEIVEKFSANGVDEHMQVNFVNRSSKVGDTIQLKAETSGEMQTLNLMIFGINGLILNVKYPEAAGKDVFTFNFELTEEMKPEIRGIVFYIRPQDGVMVYDEFSISLGFSIFNSLEISLPSKYAKTNEDLAITVKSEPGSLILLTAVDEISELISKENEISRPDIYNELTYYLNFKIPNSHDYKFEKLNNFVLEPLQQGIKCGTKSVPNLIISYTSDGQPWTHSYFPNIWFDKVFKMENENSKIITVKTPNSLKSWKIYGISVHPTKGFTIAKAQPTITIESDVAVQIIAPDMIYESEIVKVDIKVINIYENEINSMISVEVEDGILQNMTKAQTCNSFEDLDVQNPNFTLDMLPSDPSKSESIYIKATKAGNMKIKAVATVNGYSHEDERIIQVEIPNLQVKTENHFNVNWTIYNSRFDIEISSGFDRNVTLEIELPRGYVYKSSPISINDKIDTKNHGRTVIITRAIYKKFSLESIFANLLRSKTYSINMEKVFDIYKHQKTIIKIYETDQKWKIDYFPYIHDRNTIRSKNNNKCSFSIFKRCWFKN